jgi:hypothetical protein
VLPLVGLYAADRVSSGPIPGHLGSAGTAGFSGTAGISGSEGSAGSAGTAASSLVGAIAHATCIDAGVAGRILGPYFFLSCVAGAAFRGGMTGVGSAGDGEGN